MVGKDNAGGFSFIRIGALVGGSQCCVLNLRNADAFSIIIPMPPVNLRNDHVTGHYYL